LPDSEEQSALSRPEHHSLCSLGKHGLTDQGQLWGHLSESDLLFIIVINIVRIVFGSRRLHLLPGARISTQEARWQAFARAVTLPCLLRFFF
jgi:hypothetical protein